jgi:hypothetical protein
LYITMIFSLVPGSDSFAATKTRDGTIYIKKTSRPVAQKITTPSIPKSTATRQIAPKYRYNYRTTVNPKNTTLQGSVTTPSPKYRYNYRTTVNPKNTTLQGSVTTPTFIPRRITTPPITPNPSVVVPGKITAPPITPNPNVLLPLQGTQRANLTWTLQGECKPTQCAGRGCIYEGTYVAKNVITGQVVGSIVSRCSPPVATTGGNVGPNGPVATTGGNVGPIIPGKITTPQIAPNPNELLPRQSTQPANFTYTLEGECNDCDPGAAQGFGLCFGTYVVTNVITGQVVGREHGWCHPAQNRSTVAPNAPVATIGGNVGPIVPRNYTPADPNHPINPITGTHTQMPTGGGLAAAGATGAGGAAGQLPNDEGGPIDVGGAVGQPTQFFPDGRSKACPGLWCDVLACRQWARKEASDWPQTICDKPELQADVASNMEYYVGTLMYFYDIDTAYCRRDSQPRRSPQLMCVSDARAFVAHELATAKPYDPLATCVEKDPGFPAFWQATMNHYDDLMASPSCY